MAERCLKNDSPLRNDGKFVNLSPLVLLLLPITLILMSSIKNISTVNMTRNKISTWISILSKPNHRSFKDRLTKLFNSVPSKSSKRQMEVSIVQPFKEVSWLLIVVKSVNSKRMPRRKKKHLCETCLHNGTIPWRDLRKSLRKTFVTTC